MSGELLVLHAQNALLQCAELSEKQRGQVSVSIRDGDIAVLTGQLDTQSHKVTAAHAVASVPGVRNVVNDIKIEGFVETPMFSDDQIAEARCRGVIESVDVLIIGGGICGCGIARELTRYHFSIAVAEACSDVSEGASKANSGAIHPGHLVKPGTLKARLNIEGNALYSQWADELNFRFIRNGSLTLGYNAADEEKIRHAYETALYNHVPGAKLISPEEARKLEPAIEGEPIIILYLPTMGMVEPYEVVIALANNAVRNGVHFYLDHPVMAIDYDDDGYRAITPNGVICARYVVNAAGIYADLVAQMVDDRFFSLHPRRGSIVIFDKSPSMAYPFHARISYLPRRDVADSKGGGFTPTPEGNMNAGPSATETPYRDDNATYPQDVAYALSRADNCPGIVKPSDAISIFTGIRACDYKEDFIIEMSRKRPGFMHVAGIQSPGLTAAPAIARMAVQLLVEQARKRGEDVPLNEAFIPREPPKIEMRRLSYEQRNELIQRDPRYGRMICRCESITEGEILEAVRSPLVPTTVDAIKRRTRAGMGRCQGGFCQPRVVELLARELGKAWVDIHLKSGNSYILTRDNRAEVKGKTV